MATTILDDTAEYTLTRTTSAAGFTDTLTWKPGSIGANRDDITAKARQALAANTAFLAIASPTNAQVVAQVNRLTRECSALIRLVLDELADTAGT